MNKKGFTLLEVVIAMAVLSLMMVMLFSSMNQTFQTKEDIEKLDESDHLASLFLNRISKDLQFSFLLNGPEFLGSDGFKKTEFVGQEDQVAFNTFNLSLYSTQADQVNFGYLKYFLERAEGHENYKLMREEIRGLERSANEKGKMEEFLTGVKSLRFQYYDEKKKEWLKTWDSTQLEQANRLPRAVKIFLEIIEEGQEAGAVYSTIAELGSREALSY